MTIGENIKQLRLARGMTQEELANRLGVKKSAISKYEKGHVVNLKRSTIEKLATALNVQPTTIMGWTIDSESEEVKEFIEKVKKMSPDNFQRLKAIADALEET